MVDRTSRAGRIFRAVAIMFAVLGFVAGATVAGSWWFNKPRVLRMAVGPEGSPQYKFAQKLVEAAASNSRFLRITLNPVDTPVSALSLLNKFEADIAIARTDLKFPTVARSIAVLERNALFLVTARNAKLRSLAALRGRKIAVVGAFNEGLVQRMMDAVQVPATAYTLQSVDLGTAPERLIGPAAQQAVVLIAPLSQVMGLSQLERIDRRTGPTEVHGIDDGKVIERRVPGVYTDTVEAGAISGSPKWPAADIETVSVYQLLVLSSRVQPRIATELTRILFENKEDLALEREFATRIEAPELGKDEVVLAHQGAADYVNGEVKTFFERYSDVLYIGSSLLGIVASIIYGLYRLAWAPSPAKASQRASEMIAIADRCGAMTTVEEVDRASDELDTILKQVLTGLQDGRYSADGLDVLRLAYDHAHRAVAARRRIAVRNEGGAARLRVVTGQSDV